jgi:hypothetical protein
MALVISENEGECKWWSGSIHACGDLLIQEKELTLAHCASGHWWISTYSREVVKATMQSDYYCHSLLLQILFESLLSLPPSLSLPILNPLNPLSPLPAQSNSRIVLAHLFRFSLAINQITWNSMLSGLHKAKSILEGP